MRGFKSVLLQIRLQGAAPGPSPAEAKALDGILGQATTAEIFQRWPAFRQPEAPLKRLHRCFHDRIQIPRLAGAFGITRGEFGDIKPRFAGEPFHRFHELRAFGLHDEGDGIPMGAAAEAVEVIVIDVERRRLFPMKGAAALPVAPGFEQPRLPPDQTGQGRAGAKLIKETGGQGHGEGVGYTFAGKSGLKRGREKIHPL